MKKFLLRKPIIHGHPNNIGDCFCHSYHDDDCNEEDYECHWCDVLICHACSNGKCYYCSFDFESYNEDYQKSICNKNYSHWDESKNIICENCKITFCGECFRLGFHENMSACPKCKKDIFSMTEVYTKYKCDECNSEFVVRDGEEIGICINCDVVMCRECTELGKVNDKTYIILCSNCYSMK